MEDFVDTGGLVLRVLARGAAAVAAAVAASGKGEHKGEGSREVDIPSSICWWGETNVPPILSKR
jgi:hypothetical protein